MDKLVTYIFILSLVLIFVAYYAGLVTDVNAFSNAGNSLIQTATGRTANGQFAGYAQGYH